MAKGHMFVAHVARPWSDHGISALSNVPSQPKKHGYVTIL